MGGEELPGPWFTLSFADRQISRQPPDLCTAMALHDLHSVIRTWSHRTIGLIASTGISMLGYGQEVSDSLLATFYNRTLAYQFDSTAHADQIKFGFVVFETEFDTARLQKQVGPNRLSFIGRDYPLTAVFGRKVRAVDQRHFYFIGHRFFGTDTVDINITSRIIEMRNRKASIGVECGGTMGYIPSARFIFEPLRNEWSFVSEEEIIEQYLARWRARSRGQQENER